MDMGNTVTRSGWNRVVRTVGYALACSLLVLGSTTVTLGSLPSPAADAQTAGDDLGTRFEVAVDRYNADPGLPSEAVEFLLRGERVNFYVTVPEGTDFAFSFRLDSDLAIAEFAREARADATVHLRTTEATATDIVESDALLLAFVAAVDAGTVEVECVGLVTRLKCVPVTGDVPAEVVVAGAGLGALLLFAVVQSNLWPVALRPWGAKPVLRWVVDGLWTAVDWLLRLLDFVGSVLGRWGVVVWILKRLHVYDTVRDRWHRVEERVARRRGGDVA